MTIEPDGVIRLCGDLDLATADRAETALAEAVRQGGEIHLDVRELRFLDSSGLRAILSAGQRLDGTGRLILHGPVGEPKRVLELSLPGLHQWIAIDWSGGDVTASPDGPEPNRKDAE